jgi:hypothetical protein
MQRYIKILVPCITKYQIFQNILRKSKTDEESANLPIFAAL